MVMVAVVINIDETLPSICSKHSIHMICSIEQSYETDL